MRKIEKFMLAAIEHHVPWSMNNTQVSIDFNTAHVFLHGNHIASVVQNGKVMVNKDTLRLFPTSTTKSRLRDLGVDVYTKQGVTYLNGKEVQTIDLDDFNNDIDDNWTASQILKERAPHLLYELQNEFLQLAISDGEVGIEANTGNLYWKEEY